jgi:hypothetical protein
MKHSNELKYKTIIFIKSKLLDRINLEFNYLKTTKERRKEKQSSSKNKTKQNN